MIQAAQSSTSPAPRRRSSLACDLIYAECAKTLAFECDSARLKTDLSIAIPVVRVFFRSFILTSLKCLKPRCSIPDGADWRGCGCTAMRHVLQASLWGAWFYAAGFFMLNF